ncbi:hypothetical protein JZO86_14240 [Enterococcus ureasiticus]|uniref:hypothetical protein n=1 Tax=Enterococcus ureasiticus TaxID=903984 RepID=UPI001A8DD872|nr:hypothetical protein [Enterococcus ureasiticus]MBO0474858.1 hypothetical protein [Enterococcus ureasiticus]
MNTNETIIKEAINRMRQLGFYKEAINDFIESGAVKNSVRTKIIGIGTQPIITAFVYDLSKEQQKCIADFEKKYDSFVYHVIETHFEFGIVNDLLYVSNNTDQWEMEREDISSNTPCVYSVNNTYPDYSEFGSIIVQPKSVGLIRVS